MVQTAGVEPTRRVWKTLMLAITLRLRRRLVHAVGIEPTSNGLRIRCLTSQPGMHTNIIRLFNCQWEAWESNPASSTERLGYNQARLHSGIASRSQSTGLTRRTTRHPSRSDMAIDLSINLSMHARIRHAVFPFARLHCFSNGARSTRCAWSAVERVGAQPRSNPGRLAASRTRSAH